MALPHVSLNTKLYELVPPLATYIQLYAYKCRCIHHVHYLVKCKNSKIISFFYHKENL